MKKDVIVIGGGCAGMVAALEAEREGAEVILVDRGPIGIGTNSALAGGITTILSLLRPSYVTDRDCSYDQIFPSVTKELEGKISTDLSFHFQLTTNQHADEIEHYYRDFGIQSFKIFMNKKKDPISPGLDPGEMFYVFRRVGGLEHKPLIQVHCEIEEISDLLAKELQGAGLQGLEAYNQSSPGFVEELGMIEAGYFARMYDVPLYIVHVSSKEGVRRLADLRAQGVHLVGETCAHYLTLTTDQEGTLAKVNPPVRRQEDVDVVWKAVKSGLITCIGSDHGAKKRGVKGDDIWSAARAFPGMETLLPLILTHGIERGLSLPMIAELLSLNPARTFGLVGKGFIAPGYDADLVIVDLNQHRTIRAADLHSSSDFTPYDGMKVRGCPEITLLRGRVVYKHGEIVSPGQGRVVSRFPVSQGGKSSL